MFTSKNTCRTVVPIAIRWPRPREVTGIWDVALLREHRETPELDCGLRASRAASYPTAVYYLLNINSLSGLWVD